MSCVVCCAALTYCPDLVLYNSAILFLCLPCRSDEIMNLCVFNLFETISIGNFRYAYILHAFTLFLSIRSGRVPPVMNPVQQILFVEMDCKKT